ncbi:hypothetical protein Ae201684P_008222 [Aphanomyces euteiches]|uniref:Uncharacterized protein n=1 Tax=Aphanomyces euteiches TaxID=100861 RepID=A0A6G0XPJ9_9STRA|nr:hypothetical protein Ae201684_002525 [Aphanomyces euteiches]KAH9092547.1 hypothetical protein Ae201684P_008222 [Aphanomyces euteiches]KAH9146292.1 hypothetical protein AeRB84_009770 [Aphanomyces euteiches]
MHHRSDTFAFDMTADSFHDADDVIEVAEGTPYCYICLDSMNGPSGDAYELMAPCACQTYIHRSCLDGWRRMSKTEKPQTHCPTCKTAFQMEVSTLPLTRVERAIQTVSTYWFPFAWRYVTIVWVLLFVADFSHWCGADISSKLSLLCGYLSSSTLSILFPVLAVCLSVLVAIILYNVATGFLYSFGKTPSIVATTPLKIPDPPRVLNLRPLLTNTASMV